MGNLSELYLQSCLAELEYRFAKEDPATRPAELEMLGWAAGLARRSWEQAKVQQRNTKKTNPKEITLF